MQNAERRAQNMLFGGLDPNALHPIAKRRGQNTLFGGLHPDALVQVVQVKEISVTMILSLLCKGCVCCVQLDDGRPWLERSRGI